MANEKITELPSASSAALSDIMYAVQGYVSSSDPGDSVQMTIQQIASLLLSNTIQSYAGDPNSNVAGTQYQLLWDTTNNEMYVCTTTGTASTAVWKAFGIYIGGMTNGQLIIGNTGSAPSIATLTAGTGMTITNSTGSITLSAGGSGYSWTEVTGTTQAMAANNGYIANNAGLVTLTLPATMALGESVIVQGKGAGLFKIGQNAGQTVNFGSSATTTGTGGSLTATNRYDSLEILCITADTTFAVLTGAQGIFTVA